MNIAEGVGRSPLRAHSRDPYKAFRLFSDGVEEVGGGDVCTVMGGLELAVSTSFMLNRKMSVSGPQRTLPL